VPRLSGETRRRVRCLDAAGDLSISSSTPRADFSRIGIVVGHATDAPGGTGVTVVRAAEGALRAGVAVLGRATGSRELHAASADHLVNGRIDAIVLTGGSAYGLDCTAGVMRWMEERSRGFPVGGGVVPIVPATVVFDLSPVGSFDARPTPDMAYAACESASAVFEEGTVGAGTGVTVGKIRGSASAMKSGFGAAVVAREDGAFSVGAVVVVNALGDVRDASGRILAGARDDAGGFIDTTRMLARGDVKPGSTNFDDVTLKNTTLAVVATSVPLDATELTQLARVAAGALFRRITPVGTSFDGDTVFAVAPEVGERGTVQPMMLEALAVAALEQAIERAVTLAHGRDGIPGYADSSTNPDGN
jgi:L-aminopeptidase/D-esterase-like protein